MRAIYTVSSVTIVVLISVFTFIVSVLSSAVIAGMKWQKLNDKVDTMESDLKEIKGMFTMKLRE